MNPEYMREIFRKTVFSTHRPLNLEVKENHTTKYGNKSLRCFRSSYLELRSKSNQKKKLTTLSSSLLPCELYIYTFLMVFIIR